VCAFVGGDRSIRWPVSFQSARPRPATSSGKMTQVSHSLAVVNWNGLGSRWNSCMLNGQKMGQPPCVSSSPAMCAAQPSAITTASIGMCQCQTGSRVRSAPVRQVMTAAAMPSRSPWCPPTCSARSAAE